MPQREGFHRQVFAVEQYSFARGVDDVEFQVEAQLLAEHVENLAQDAFAFCEGVHSHGASVLVERHGGQQPGQSQEMVAMEVGDEYIGDSGERQAETAQLKLCPFPAVNQHQAAAIGDRLCRWHVAHCRRGGAAAENGDVEIAHLWQRPYWRAEAMAASTSAFSSSPCLSRLMMVPSGPKRIMQGIPEIP